MKKHTDKTIEKQLRSIKVSYPENLKQDLFDSILQDIGDVTFAEKKRRPLMRQLFGQIIYQYFYMGNKKVFLTSILVLAIVSLSMGGVVKAADSANPGDPIYFADRLGESIDRTFTLNQYSKSELEMDLIDERMSELEFVLSTETDLTEEEIQAILDDIDAQLLRVQERLQNSGELENGELEQLMNRYREQIETNLRLLLKLRAENQRQVGLNDDLEDLSFKFQERAREEGIEIEVEYEEEDGNFKYKVKVKSEDDQMDDSQDPTEIEDESEDDRGRNGAENGEIERENEYEQNNPNQNSNGEDQRGEDEGEDQPDENEDDNEDRQNEVEGEGEDDHGENGNSNGNS
ncbi:hypothetical protein H6762_00780 [Candidatus Nomurabacteria bacterium]|uniref:DUF5667 domain-containing protein n=1 Tax=Candidatus Dojkabacteria bacterium TaxID=2099670 RepID=A0A955KWR7_9BACT|nr:hypothetical protein [Candidatus Dojkabacteria bacterium]MCB9789511.1 hypothetical protein [Candidatus Nomurabacteria bacterium]